MSELQQYWEVARGTLGFMLLVSVLTMAIALERWMTLLRARWALSAIEARVMGAARKGQLDEARTQAARQPAPLQKVFVAGLDRALGKVRGEPGTAMSRESKRALVRLRGSLWILGSIGALMPFAGLLGTVIGVMGSFQAIGESQQGGFAVVSSGISHALVATAAGLFVALEAVVFFNALGQQAAGIGRDLAFMVDELGELLRTQPAPTGEAHAERPAAGE